MLFTYFWRYLIPIGLLFSPGALVKSVNKYTVTERVKARAVVSLTKVDTGTFLTHEHNVTVNYSDFAIFLRTLILLTINTGWAKNRTIFKSV